MTNNALFFVIFVSSIRLIPILLFIFLYMKWVNRFINSKFSVKDFYFSKKIFFINLGLSDLEVKRIFFVRRLGCLIIFLLVAFAALKQLIPLYYFEEFSKWIHAPDT